MKPQFANVFNVSVNDNRSECSLSFYHMYMQHNYTPQPKGLIDMPEKTVGEVASIMLTQRRGARAHAPAHPELRPAGGQRMSAVQTLRPGRYRHFKGKEYELLFVANALGNIGADGRLPRALRGARRVGAPRRHVERDDRARWADRPPLHVYWRMIFPMRWVLVGKGRGPLPWFWD